MKLMKTTEAVGQVLCHDMTQIIPDVTKDAVFRKGHIVREEDIPVLLSIGKDHIYVWEKDDTKYHEDEAADILRGICQNEYMRATDPKEGKIELIAESDGLFQVDEERLLKVNSLPEMMIATRRTNFPVKKGDKLAGTRVIPLVIEKEKMEEAISYIRENYAKDLNMAMVSNHICMNYSLFSAAFKEHTGVNFVNYLKEIRIAEAKRLLIQTEDKITEIAKQVGFENDKHFMKSFKTACGVSPSEFRKDYKMVSNGKGGQDE